ncbi:MAG TPA: phenylalanine--tRNA ligase subunit alpha [Chitinophagales bacterium]|nr:phenylalanine--tRNA ligase subunit alpha [Chitinophagales bacterium]
MEIFDKAAALLEEAKNSEIKDANSLEQYRIKYLGSKNILKELFGEIRNIPKERKKEFGQLVNAIKQAAEDKYQTTSASFKSLQEEEEAAQLDLTRPGYNHTVGSRHPVRLVMEEMVEIFKRIGFVVEEDREIEDDWHNFSALNLPEDHPARDMQDTFYISLDPATVLRTHTSSVQVRVMGRQKPPIRILSPGKVFRNETISARSHCFFHQVEGLYIDKDVSFADLLQTLQFFASEFFGPDTKIKVRPSFFPFTEPSAEVDVSCFLCHGEGCNVCKHTGWVEILGCGIVDPKVLENSGIDPNEYSGFAFGVGVERIALMKYGVKDIRTLSENDVRFLDHFKSVVV